MADEGLIRSKLRPPTLGDGFIERPRVRRELAAAAEGRRILLVVASAGAGKTTAAVQFLASRPRPRAWLTLAAADDSPGRLLTYLAAAAEPVDAEASRQARRFLADGLSAEDRAAILGESLPPGATLVVDDLHHLEARASVLRVLRAFLDTVAAGTLVVLLSRRLVDLELGRDVLAGAVGTVSEPELSFRVDEIDELLVRRGLPGSPGAIEDSSRGWAAGIVFEALRESRRQGAPPTSEDPFFEYLGSEVLGSLPDALRESVLRSALLEVVSPERLRSLLGVESADALFEEICRQHLPGTREPEGVRYNPRFREFLLARLAEERPEGMRTLMTRHARALLADGHVEEAADVLVGAGDPDEAEAAVEAAAATITSRGDWEKALAWLDLLDDDAPARRPRLRGLQVRSLLMSRRQDEVAGLVEGMRRSGELDRLMADAPDVAGWAIWALHGDGRWGELARMAPPAGSSRRSRAMRYILDVGIGADPPRDLDAEELDRPQPLHVALESALYYRGRLADVERLAWAAAGRGPVTATLAEIYRVAVLRGGAGVRRGGPRGGPPPHPDGAADLARARLPGGRAHGLRGRGGEDARADGVRARGHRPARGDARLVRASRAAVLPGMGGHLARGRAAAAPRARGEGPRAPPRGGRGDGARRAAAGAARGARLPRRGRVALGRRGRARRGRRRGVCRLGGDGEPRPPGDRARGCPRRARPAHRRRARPTAPSCACGPSGAPSSRWATPGSRSPARRRASSSPPRSRAAAGPGSRGRRSWTGCSRAAATGPATCASSCIACAARCPPGVDVISSEGRLTWLPADAVAVDDQVLEALVSRARREVGALAGRGPSPRQATRLPTGPADSSGATDRSARGLDGPRPGPPCRGVSIETGVASQMRTAAGVTRRGTSRRPRIAPSVTRR